MRLGIVDAAGLRFGWKRHVDHAVEDVVPHIPAFIQADVVIIMGESPLTAEVCPLFPDELGARMRFA
jgi:hypothetical protein